MIKEPVKLEKEKYTLHVNYSDEAVENKTMKFITPSGDEFEITADEMVSILIGQVNSDLIAATFVESDRVNVVDVMRQIRVRADRDISKGEEIRLEYTHPYPLEFAVIEEAAKLAKIKMDVPMMILDVDYIKAAKERSTPEQKKFVDLIYKFFKDLRPNRATRRRTASSP